MKRACYAKHPDNTYTLYHLRSMNRDGSIDIERIPELSDDFSEMDSMFIIGNRNGYGILGDYETLKTKAEDEAYERKCGDNQMDIDEL